MDPIGSSSHRPAGHRFPIQVNYYFDWGVCVYVLSWLLNSADLVLRSTCDAGTKHCKRNYGSLPKPFHRILGANSSALSGYGQLLSRVAQIRNILTAATDTAT